MVSARSMIEGAAQANLESALRSGGGEVSRLAGENERLKGLLRRALPLLTTMHLTQPPVLPTSHQQMEATKLHREIREALGLDR